jgi:hypothetical protein
MVGLKSHVHDEFLDFVQDVINGGHLDGAANGVARQAVERGIGSLSARQRYVLDHFVVEPHTVEACARCDNDIPWSEMYLAVQMFDNMCSWCSHMAAKEA